MTNDSNVTQLLRELTEGREDVMEELIPAVYTELRALARRQLSSERADHTLSPTALVHEAYLKLVDVRHVDWQDRAHFFAMAARQMRRVLIDHARARSAEKRGGGQVFVTLHDALDGARADAEELVAMDDALSRLAEVDERACRVVECRCFAGLSVQETASALGTSPTTVKRDWAFARSWLNRALAGEHPGGSDG